MKSFNLNKYFVPTDGVTTIAVEVHQSATTTTAADIFDGAVKFVTQTSPFTRTQVLQAGEPVCSKNPTSTSYACVYIFTDKASKYSYVSNSAWPQTITYSLPNVFEYVNSYRVINPSSSTYGYPTSWILKGSRDNGNTWELIDTQINNGPTSTSAVKTYNVASNKFSYSSFQFELTAATKSYVALGGLALQYTQMEYIGDGLVYPETSYEHNVSDAAITITPVSSGFSSYTSTPPLPENIDLDEDTGVINCHPSESSSGTYVISAINGAGVTKTFSITFTIVGCDQPEKALVTFIKTSKSYASYESYEVYNSAGTLVHTGSGFTSSGTVSATYCLPADTLYRFVLKSSTQVTWYSGSKLSVQMDYAGSTFIIAEMGHSEGATSEYWVNIQASLLQKDANWQYAIDSLPTGWDTNNAITGLSPLSFSSKPATTSGFWILRNTFNFGTKTNYEAIEIHVYLRAGYVININGHELYRYGVSNTDTITTSTKSTLGSSSTASWKVVTAPIHWINTGSNIITILSVPMSAMSITNVDFNAFIIPLGKGISDSSRYWSVTTSCTSGTASYLFDYVAYSDYSYTTTTVGKEIYGMVNFGSTRAEYMNKQCIRSSNTNFEYDPSDWGVYGYTSKATYELIGNVTNAYFSARRQMRCFYFPQNTKAYQGYRIMFSENAKPTTTTYGFKLSEVRLTIEDIDSITIPELALTPNSITSYKGIAFPEVSSSSPYYSNFRITPALQLPLEIDTSTGSIRGVPNTVMPKTRFTITATDAKGVDKTTTLDIEITYCLPPNILVDIVIKGDYNPIQQGFILSDNLGNVVAQQVGVSYNQESHYTYCVPANSYNFTMTDTAGNGWTAGYAKIFLEDGTQVFQGALGPKDAAKSYPLSLGFVVPPLYGEWQYLNSGIAAPSNWNSINYANTWSTSMNKDFPVPIGTTQYYRREFVINDASVYASAEINVKSSCGFIAYINGYEVYRSNLPDTVDSSTNAIEKVDNTQLRSSTLPVILGKLLSGKNVIAIEVHQCNSTIPVTSNDSIFSFSLIANGSWRVMDGEGSSAGTTNTNNLFDNSVYTTMGVTDCVGYEILYTYNNNRKEYISSYSLSNMGNCNVRTPTSWTLFASNDGEKWATLDTQVDHAFTAYYETSIFDIFTIESYNMYKIRIDACDAVPLGGIEDDSTCLDSNSQLGLQLSDISFYAKTIKDACSSTQGYTGALNNTFAFKECPTYYSGRVMALCVNGQFGVDTAECTPDAPYKIVYPYTNIQLNPNTDFSYTPQVYGAEYTCSITGDLVEGISFDTRTGTLSGKVNDVFEYVSYTVNCKNQYGSTTTDVYISSVKGSGIDTILLIMIIVLAVLIVAIVISLLVKCEPTNKTKKQNTNKNPSERKGLKV
ncbi:hypothetical protein WA158_002708 [Blastocystis sp. Blastoise]